MNVGIIVIVVNVAVNTLRRNPSRKRREDKLMSRLDSMHAFISRTIIIVIPLSMRQSCAVVDSVIVIVIVTIGIIIIIIGGKTVRQKKIVKRVQ